MSNGIISGMHVGDSGILLTHQQHADDTILFLLKDNNTIHNCRRLLECLSLMTSLEINYSKSALVSWNKIKDHQWLHDMASVLECKVQTMPFRYLGIPIGGNSRCSKFWEPVISNIEGRLAMRKHKLLLIAGRSQLIKSVLNNLPIHFLSMPKIPDSHYYG